MLDFILAPIAILAILLGWIEVQQLARRFAERHPEFGPAREEGGGCGSNCSCSGGKSCCGDTCATEHTVVLKHQHQE
ncbi:MAG: chemotaxis protein [Gammaproteobacteria bacterium]|nr:chemotaxis protein [Gammaproteobacteria bacterium]